MISVQELYIIGPLGAGVYVSQVHTSYPQLRKAANEKILVEKGVFSNLKFPFVLPGSNPVSSQCRL
jgi:hypothetical protein